MQARIVWVPGMNAYDLWLVRGDALGSKSQYATVEDGRLAWHDYDPAQLNDAKPALRVHGQEHHMLVAAFTDPDSTAELPPAPNAHLKDAIAVRDRLLALIEAKGIA